MIINSPPEYRFKALPDCWVTQRKSKSRWRNMAYHPRLSQSLPALAERLLLENKATTHEDVLNAIGQAVHTLEVIVQDMVKDLGFDTIKEMKSSFQNEQKQEV